MKSFRERADAPATGRRGAITGHDQETHIGEVPPLLTQEGPAHGTAAEPGHLRQPCRGGEARAGGAVFQARVSRAPAPEPRAQARAVWLRWWDSPLAGAQGSDWRFNSGFQLLHRPRPVL